MESGQSRSQEQKQERDHRLRSDRPRPILLTNVQRLATPRHEQPPPPPPRPPDGRHHTNQLRKTPPKNSQQYCSSYCGHLKKFPARPANDASGTQRFYVHKQNRSAWAASNIRAGSRYRRTKRQTNAYIQQSNGPKVPTDPKGPNGPNGPNDPSDPKGHIDHNGPNSPNNHKRPQRVTASTAAAAAALIPLKRRPLASLARSCFLVLRNGCYHVPDVAVRLCFQ